MVKNFLLLLIPYNEDGSYSNVSGYNPLAVWDDRGTHARTGNAEKGLLLGLLFRNRLPVCRVRNEGTDDCRDMIRFRIYQTGSQTGVIFR